MTSKEAPAQDPKDQETVTKNKRADYKKEKELDEARKAGTAPPEVDEEGRDINPHIPQYVKQVPWYIGEDRPTLSHQRTQEEKVKHFDKIDKWYKKGIAKGKIATKFRKGACENCGAITHKRKDCLERPRKVGARFNGEDIRPDELLPGELNFDYDGKRDRWAGYDVSVHSRVVDEYVAVDEAKRQLKAAQLEEDLASGSATAAAILNDDGVEEKYAEEMDMPGTRLDADVRQTVRNLRIREDTAKYLHNLDSNSAHYDPKTRSMRENPFADKGEKGALVDYVGDNFVRSSGIVPKIAEQQLFAWEAHERGADVHLFADPTKLELLHRTYAVKKDSYKNEVKDGILDKYGGAEHLEAPPQELLLAQTEEYVEYSRTGKVIRGQEKATIQSKYEEDVYVNNHESVWGSHWKDFQWGYACCHSFIKGSYCTGEAGKNAEKTDTPMIQFNPAPAPENTDNSRRETNADEAESDTRQKTLVELHKEKLEQNKASKSSAKSAAAAASASEETASAERLKRALAAEEEREREMTKFMRLDERKRPYNSLQTDSREPTEEEMAAYRIKRARDDDPMAAMLK